MTEKRFDIVVQDKVARTIKDEITAIGNASRGTRGFISQLKAEMAGLASAQGGLGGAATAATRGFREEAAAANAARTAMAAQRQEAEALTRALLAQAKAAQGVASMRPTGAGQAYGPPTPQATGQPAAAARVNTSNLAGAARNIREVGEASKLSTQYAAQLGFQLNDIGVSLASGQKPLTVFIQQGAQIAQIPAQAGLSWKQFGSQVAGTLGVVKRTGDAALDAAAAQATAAAAAIAAADGAAAGNVRVAETEVSLATAQQGAAATAAEQAAATVRLTAALEALAAANGEAAVTAKALSTAQAEAGAAAKAAGSAATTGLSLFARAGLVGITVGTALVATTAALNHEANNDGMKKYAKDMGYTSAEVKKLNAVTVGFGDVFKAVFQVGFERVASAFGIKTKDIKRAWSTVLDYLASGTRATISGLYALLTGFAYTTVRTFNNMKAHKFENPFNTLKEGYKSAYNDAQKFMDDVVKRGEKNARDRQDALAKQLYDKPREKKQPKGWDRAQNLKNDNAELQAQINLLGLYGDELERANQLEQISKKYRDHNVPLTQAETAALADKIQKLQEGRRVQEAMTAADEAANGPLRKYNDTLAALDKLLDAGKITQAQYTAQTNLAERSYQDATDALAAYKRELADTAKTAGLYGKALDDAQYKQQLMKAYTDRGESPYEGGSVGTDGNDIVVNGSRKLRGDITTAMDEHKRQRQQDEYGQYFEQHDSKKAYDDPNDPSYVLDNYKKLYEEIQRLRDNDLISEADAAQRKKDLDKDLLDTRLQYTSSVLDSISGLQKSKNRELAALGKAAAIAEATIDGYRAVQKALAGPPGPPWSYAIAASVAVTTAANVAKIAGVGFMSGGYTGNGGVTEAAGTVHGQEYVFDAASTKRIGVPALDAMRRGMLSQPANDNRGMARSNVRIVQGPGTYVEATERSDGEIEVIAQRVVRQTAPGVIADHIQGKPNGKVSKAISGTFGTRRMDR